MRQLLPLAGAAVLAGTALAACSSAAGLTINLYISPEDHLQTVVDRCTAAAAGKYKIVYNKLPRGADGQREQMVRRLAAGDASLDVLGLDVTWVPEFAEAGWAEEWTGANAEAATRDVLPGPLATAKWNGKLYGATKNTNVQLLWYDDRITPSPPKTFDELMSQAQQLKAAGKPYQVVFTGAQYEGLVVFYNTLVASSGGHILSDDGRSVVMDDGAVRALELLKRLTTAGITDPSLTNQKEDDIRQAFQRGQAATELNWPFVYASYAKEKPQELAHFKWARYPSVTAGRPSRVTIGGFNLAVSAYSKHKPEAFEAALCLRNAASQKYQALVDGVPPSIATIYRDTSPLDPAKPADAKENPTMADQYPMKDDIQAALTDAAVRPLTPAYQNLSTVMSKVLSPPSAIDVQATAQELRERLADALASRGIIP
ncbi:ABC transporter substrate-binding protein [Amycolatopsis sp. SID8362]|uniref:ABC transporter substrate-binding protein n=1 Tax=Amycolatopsis sp. SID8362 TaxID=2690346 RepID=UPI001369F634|nr:ABC transporter substrate-binding protein [Amycolatopsis sp. SID8362]NBH06155.1 extracellular solute-binding protein [Amycolatopsis sp. SID8362]NED42854.1 ABC transporter substrate-binding protein [Amycolatopsis sp. SID8362]